MNFLEIARARRSVRRKPFARTYSVDRFQLEDDDATACETLKGDSE